MDRRSFIAAALGTFAAPTIAQIGSSPNRTLWKVRSSEGFDAIAFLGPLARGDLYLPYYEADVAVFAPLLPAAVSADIGTLWEEAAKAEFGLLGPSLSVIFSAGHDADLKTMIDAATSPEAILLQAYRRSPYWEEKDWRWFVSVAPRLRKIFEAMLDAGFPAFRTERTSTLEQRIAELPRSLAGFDVIQQQEKLTGRTFDPHIEVVLLQFCKPHGIKVQGQTFLQAADWNIATTIRNAAHEMLHPPVAMEGSAAKAALAVLAKDPLIPRIVRHHDPRWGYTSLDGMFNEDLAQALDQLIAESLGVARNPADRWRKSDDGMHVLAGGLYGLLRDDKWAETGGNIEQWLAKATAAGRLAPPVLHKAAARVLERPLDKLWPLPKA
jgi:hypothetical protein